MASFLHRKKVNPVKLDKSYQPDLQLESEASWRAVLASERRNFDHAYMAVISGCGYAAKFLSDVGIVVVHSGVPHRRLRPS